MKTDESYCTGFIHLLLFLSLTNEIIPLRWRQTPTIANGCQK